MDDAFYDNRLRVALVGTANVAQTVAFIAEHERSTHINYHLQSAHSVFLNVMGSHDSLLMMEVNEATTPIYEAMNPDGEFYWVVNLDESLADKIFVMIIVRI